MQQFDRAAISGLGIPGLALMENAGRAFVDILAERVGEVRGRSVAVVCGKGNNGGDGFVIARHLANRGASVDVFLLSPSLSGDAAANLAPLRKMSRLKNSGIRLIPAARLSPPWKLSHDIIVDAIFGTGFKGEPKGVYRRAMEAINASGSMVAAVDIPSGVNGTTGGASAVALRANLTVTMGLAKPGHFTGEGKECSGEVVVADISIPPSLFKVPQRPVYRVLAEDVRQKLPRRPLSAHKYSVGKVLVIGGSREFTGAPSMTSLAALRSGAGAVVLGVPSSIHPVMARKLTEVILQALPESAEGTIGSAAFDDIMSRMKWADVVAIGPGLSRSRETDRLVVDLLASINKPVVLDADALTALVGETSVLKKRKFPTVLTPHAGELSRLSGWSSARIESDRVTAARESARLFRSVVVLKGSGSVISGPGGACFINSTGNPGMATIGSGDVLTGLIAGLMAQRMEAEQAAWAGVFVHGLAGDMVAEKSGMRSLLAMDILNALPNALKAVEGGLVNC